MVTYVVSDFVYPHKDNKHLFKNKAPLRESWSIEARLKHPLALQRLR